MMRRNQQQERDRMSDPAERAKELRQRRSTARATVNQSLDWVPLSEEVRERLVELMAEQAIEFQELSMAADFNAAQPDPQKVNEMSAKFEGIIEKHARERLDLLGPESDRLWREFEQSSGARYVVTELQDRLPMDQRLRREELKPLISAIAAAEQSITDEFIANEQAAPDDPGEAMKRARDYDARRREKLLAVASKLLSTEQAEQFERYLTEQADMFAAE